MFAYFCNHFPTSLPFVMFVPTWSKGASRPLPPQAKDVTPTRLPLLTSSQLSQPFGMSQVLESAATSKRRAVLELCRALILLWGGAIDIKLVPQESQRYDLA
jgi:hypothetical protein